MNTPKLEEIINIVKEAGKLITDGARRKAVRQKGDADFVTDSDLAVQTYLKDRLTSLFPAIGFLAEEEPECAVDKEKPMWILDPIDGTMNFIRDLGLSAISLALVNGGETQLGIVYNPANGEIFYAERGCGAYLCGEPIRVSSVESLSGALAAVGTSPYYKPKTGECFDIYRELFLSCLDIRRLGSAALDICYVAAGRFDCYYEYILSIWDFAAARLILTEAGGMLTNTRGEPTGIERKSPVVATNGKLHGALLATVNKYMKG